MWLFSEPHVDVDFKLVVLPSIPLESVSSTAFAGKKWPNKKHLNFTNFSKHSRQFDFKQTTINSIWLACEPDLFFALAACTIEEVYV